MSPNLEDSQLPLAGRYQVLRKIGAGGMATVYAAQDLVQTRQVAIKVLLPELTASMAADRFVREIEIASALVHPNIVGLYDSGVVDGLLYYVMPYVEGVTLRDRLTLETQLDIGEALSITRQIAEGLSYAHQQGIIHRDIKPANVLLADGRAVLADFGIARAMDEATTTKLTATGVAVGSIMYMSPEQSDGLAPVDERADIYSLGCVLYEMLVGEPPYTGPSGHAILAKAMAGNIPSARVVRDNVSWALDSALSRALEPVPADRFRTMEEFIEALSHPEIASRGGTAPRWRRRFSGRTVVYAAVIALALMSSGFWVASQLRGDPDFALPAPSSIAPDRGTDDDAAYDAYVKGASEFRSRVREDVGRAIDEFTIAIELDPDFVEAYWALVQALSYSSFNWQDLPDGTRPAKEYLEDAMVLAPDETGTHIAAGWYYYWGLGELETALEHFDIALAREPRNAEVTSAVGYVNRRLGRWDRALEQMLESFDQDPRREILAMAIGRSYLRLRMFPEALRFLDLAISIEIDASSGYSSKLLYSLVSGGAISDVERVVREGARRVGSRWKIASEPGALMIISVLALEDPALLMEVLKPQELLEPQDRLWQLLVDGAVAQSSARYDDARAFHEAALDELNSLVTFREDNSVFHLLFAHVYASLGMDAKALSEANRAVELEPVEKDAMDTWPLETLARVHAMLGHTDEAIQLLEELSEMPSLVTAHTLNRDPVWDPIRDHPRFRALVEPH